ncbi:MAG: hypothetical protein CVT83_02425, partial [Alphaproteobacteria bacterium HGW-Alphaproteobacteria-5]
PRFSGVFPILPRHIPPSPNKKAIHPRRRDVPQIRNARKAFPKGMSAGAAPDGRNIAPFPSGIVRDAFAFRRAETLP